MTFLSKNQESNKGYIALVSVLVLGAIALLIALTLNFFNLTSFLIFRATSASTKSLYLASACAEEGLRKLREDPAYAGNETINLDGSSCLILPIETGEGGVLILKTSSNYEGYPRRLRIEIGQVSPQIRINSWQEVADF